MVAGTKPGIVHAISAEFSLETEPDGKTERGQFYLKDAGTLTGVWKGKIRKRWKSTMSA